MPGYTVNLGFIGKTEELSTPDDPGYVENVSVNGLTGVQFPAPSLKSGGSESDGSSLAGIQSGQPID